MGRPRNTSIAVSFFWRANRGYTLYWRDPLTGAKRTQSAKSADPRKVEREAAELEITLRGARGGGIFGWCDLRAQAESSYPGLSSRGWDEMRGSMDWFERVLGGVRDLNQLATVDMQRLSTAISSGGKRSKATVAKHLRNLHALLNWAKQSGWIVAFPHFDIPTPRKGFAGKGEPARVEEIAALKFHLTNYVDAAHHAKWCFMLDGMRASGLRLTEALQLSWDVGPVRVIVSEVDKIAAIEWEGAQKSGKHETSPTTPAFADLLLTVPPGERKGFVFHPIAKGARITHWAIDHKIAKARADGWLKIRLHDLRRAFARECSEKYMPADLAALMRCGVPVIMKYYAKGNSLGTSKRLRELETGRRLADETTPRIA